MHIYIDESGNFLPLTPRRSKVSSVAALAIPSGAREPLFAAVAEWRNGTGHADEIKGAQLGEQDVAELIRTLARFDVLAEVYVIDAGMHDEAEVTAFREVQAELIGRHAGTGRHPRVAADAARIRDAVRRMPNQLFVQAFLTMQLVQRVTQTTTLYYARNAPQELGSFTWMVDAKGSRVTAAEDFWATHVLPLGDHESLTSPFLLREDGDYSSFGRFIEPPQLAPLIFVRGWHRPPSPRGTINFRRILTENLTFGDSNTDVGLQLADVVASASARAFNGRLKPEGWTGLGSLMTSLDHQAIQMARLTNRAPGAKRFAELHGPHADVMERPRPEKRL